MIDNSVVNAETNYHHNYFLNKYNDTINDVLTWKTHLYQCHLDAITMGL